MNRVIEFFDPFPEPEVEDDYFVVETRGDMFFVTLEAVEEVVRQLNEHVRWLTFRDLSTRWHRILASEVYLLYESTAAQRAAARAFWRARRLEAKADRRSWEDDD